MSDTISSVARRFPLHQRTDYRFHKEHHQKFDRHRPLEFLELPRRRASSEDSQHPCHESGQLIEGHHQ